MKGFIARAALTTALLFGGAGAALADQPADLHCPAGGVKVEANGGTQETINDTVLPAGTLFCVKAGPGNTGILTADGETTLQEYAPDGKDVSYFVVYTDEEEPTPTPTPSPSPEPEPSEEPPVDNPPKDKPPVEPGHNTGKVGSGPLPTTGINAGEASLIGLGLLAVAGVTLWATRRRDIS